MPREDLITRDDWRAGTAAAWTAANPVLALREVGFETDTGRVKFGDASTAWAALPYAFNGAAWSAVTGKPTTLAGYGITDDALAHLTVQGPTAGIHFRPRAGGGDGFEWYAPTSATLGLYNYNTGDVLYVTSAGVLGATTFSGGRFQFYDANWGIYRDDANETGKQYSLVTEGGGAGTRHFLWVDSTGGNAERFGFYVGNVENTAGHAHSAFFNTYIVQGGTAGYSALQVNVAEFETGSGDKRLLDLSKNNSTKFTVKSDGDVTFNDTSSTTPGRQIGGIAKAWRVITDALRRGYVSLCAQDYNGERVGFTVEASGSAPMISFYGATPVIKPTVTGSRGANAALASLLTALQSLGLVNDSSS